jgi:hypothetical protein
MNKQVGGKRKEMPMDARKTLALVVACWAGMFCSQLLVGADGQAKPSPQSKASVRAEAKQKAVTRAQAVPRQMGFDLSKYVSIPLDKNEPPGVLNDSDIRPFVAPVAIESDWWIVLFLPIDPKTGPPVCVYLDKRLDVVRGYLIGPPRKPISNTVPKGERK